MKYTSERGKLGKNVTFDMAGDIRLTGKVTDSKTFELENWIN